jgi:hypothetical protein
MKSSEYLLKEHIILFDLDKGYTDNNDNNISGKIIRMDELFTEKKNLISGPELGLREYMGLSLETISLIKRYFNQKKYIKTDREIKDFIMRELK